jgi:hypothetical protein
MLRLLVLGLVAGGIVLDGCGGTAGDDGTASDGGGSAPNRTELTARLPAIARAEKLATLDTRTLICAGRKRCPPSRSYSPEPTVILAYYTQLINLGFRCKAHRLSVEHRLSRLADHTVKTQKLLAKEGEYESLLSIISNVYQSILRGTPRQPCSDVFDAYVTFVPRGRPHEIILQPGG